MTAVINATAAAVIEHARAHPKAIGAVLAAQNGIQGALEDRLIDTAALSSSALLALSHTPGGVFGSCRLDLEDPQTHPDQYARLFAVFKAHNIRYFLYNGGNGSMDTVGQISRYAKAHGHDLVCVGVPKTIDNDLVGTDTSPGFGSAAKYLATSFYECTLDLASMVRPKQGRTRLFLMEVMGRNTGWLAAACGLASPPGVPGPHRLVLPECPLNEADLFETVEEAFSAFGYCALAVSEGARTSQGDYLLERSKDEGGYVQLGGAGLWLGAHLSKTFNTHYHVATPDYAQRSAGHLRSATDLAQARAVGKAAVDMALAGHDAMMCSVVRDEDKPYRWHTAPVPVETVAKLERQVPRDFLSPDGFSLSEKGRTALQPLIEGEVSLPWAGGLPAYFTQPLPLKTHV